MDAPALAFGWESARAPALVVIGVEGNIVGYLSLIGILIPPLGGVFIGDRIALGPAGQSPLSTLTEKDRGQALVPYVLGCAVA